MIRLYATLLVVLLSASPTGGRAAGQQREPEPTPPVWMSAVEAHTPGFDDQALRTITSLSPNSFGEVRRLLENRKRTLSVESFNRLVHRGALLHMDAAIVQAGSIQSRQTPLRGAARLGRTAVLSIDGGFEGFDVSGEHWQFGRLLLDMTLPQPSEDQTARLWYVTAAAFLANRALLADQLPHLSKAARIFPDDPDLLFVNGCYHEVMASPRVRPMIDSTTLPPGVRISAPSAPASWRLAEDFFRRAVEARPDFIAARVRRGRALDRLGRHDEAIRVLRDAATHTADPALLYYAALFEGAAQESLGNVTMARESYERAAAGFPNAQSPQLALSRMARARGDRGTAQAAAERVFTRVVQGEMDDPWWTYHLWFVRNLDDLFAELRKPFMPAAAPNGAR
jgi:tetratricopeptide (TPR) repeat protein